MKRLFTALGILALLIALSAGHLVRLGNITERQTEQLDQARARVCAQDWEQARALTDSAFREFQRHDFYFHSTLRHTDLDAIRSSYREAMAFLDLEEDPAECAAVLARLSNQLELLMEAELPSVKNLL